MGNQREIRQVTPREGVGVVLLVRDGASADVSLIMGDHSEWHRFYTYLCPAGEPISFPNLDGPDVTLHPMRRDRVVIQSGGKMWCGYDAFVERVRTLAPFLEDALFFVGDELDYIDEFGLSDGELHYRRVHEGGWRSVEEFIRSLGIGNSSFPSPA